MDILIYVAVDARLMDIIIYVAIDANCTVGITSICMACGWWQIDARECTIIMNESDIYDACKCTIIMNELLNEIVNK
jgi:hypothetical protein